MDQWNNGGAPNFIPLKEWRTKFLPDAWRSAANETYRTREIIAKKVLTYPNVEAFVILNNNLLLSNRYLSTTICHILIIIT
jgi:hypothetical protein